MKRIGLISDTHSFIDDLTLIKLEECDEVWHAGDVGSINVVKKIEAIKPLKAVFGNIDNQEIRSFFPKNNRFNCEKVDVWITHIGGYPNKYNKDVRIEMKKKPPKLFICGHSHILKVMYDNKYNLLYLNPGSIGKYGIHKVRTLLRFTIDYNKIKDLEVIEFKK